jgi:hypothetical protein
MGINVDSIVKVYSGRKGQCMCGCAGKYSYNPGEDRESWQEVNVRSVKIIAGKVLNNPQVKWDANKEYAYVEDGARTRVVYFKRDQPHGGSAS